MSARGFSLVEVLLATTVLAVAAMAVASGGATAHVAERTLDLQTLAEARGHSYLERLVAVPFGNASDGPADAAELTEVFDEDDLLGTVTLHELRAFGPAEFTVPASATPGRWRVVVSDDLDADGDVDAEDATQAEGRGDILRISVFYDGRLVAQTIRFDPVGSP
jgi:prepilin-type N-terminal cleavage/methylation domain-containing protein